MTPDGDRKCCSNAAGTFPPRSPTTRSPLPSVGPPYHLPDDFLWGTATAAYQIEHTQDDDWAAFEAEVLRTGRCGSLGPGKPQPGHIHKLADYPEEVRRKKTDRRPHRRRSGMAAAMGHNAYRFSLSWARLFPTENQRDPDPAGIAFIAASSTFLRSGA